MLFPSEIFLGGDEELGGGRLINEAKQSVFL